MASKNKTSLLWDTALFLERAMSLIYINYSLNSSLLYIKPLHLMLANTLLFPWGETHHVYQVIVILYLHFTQHCSLLHLWNYFYWFTTKRQVKKNEENVEDSKVNGFILYKRIVCNFKKIQSIIYRIVKRYSTGLWLVFDSFMQNDWANVLTKLRGKHKNLKTLNKSLKMLKNIEGEI